jgi:hypothetical protein
VKFFTFDEISLNNSSLLLLSLSHLIKKCASSSISLAKQFLHKLKLHSMNKTSWYSSVTKMLKIFNIQNTMHLNKNKFGQSLRRSLVKKYLLDWQRSNDMLKDGKLVIYLFLKTNFGLEKYLTLINNFSYRKSICRFRVYEHHLCFCSQICHLKSKNKYFHIIN